MKGVYDPKLTQVIPISHVTLEERVQGTYSEDSINA